MFPVVPTADPQVRADTGRGPSISAPTCEIAEEVYEPCGCDVLDLSTPSKQDLRYNPSCYRCHGSGLALTKRVIRPIPKPSFSEQQAQADIKSLYAVIARAVKTLSHAAAIMRRGGLATEAAETESAAARLAEELDE